MPLRRMLRQHWMVAGIAVVALWGYWLPAAGELAGRHLSWLVGTLMLMMGLGVGFRRLRRRMAAWRPNLLAIGLVYLLAPLLSWLAGRWLYGGRGEVFTGLMLVGTTSTTLSSCIVYTRLAGGDEALALWLSVTSTLLCTLVQPLLLALALGAAVPVPAGMLITRLAMVLLLPLTLGMLLRELLGEERVAPVGSYVTRGAALIILIVLMASVAEGRELLGSWRSLPVLGLVAGLHLLLLGGAALGARLLGLSRAEGIAVLFCGTQKTLQIPAYLAIRVLGTPAAALAPVLFHVFQLVLDSLLVSRLAGRTGVTDPPGP